MLNEYIDTEYANMRKWMEHFQNFDTYCEVFLFDENFICPKSRLPYDIQDKSKIISEYDLVKEDNFWNQNSKQWEETFNNVSRMILARTESMMQVINGK